MYFLLKMSIFILRLEKFFDYSSFDGRKKCKINEMVFVECLKCTGNLHEIKLNVKNHIEDIARVDSNDVLGKFLACFTVSS